MQQNVAASVAYIDNGGVVPLGHYAWPVSGGRWAYSRDLGHRYGYIESGRPDPTEDGYCYLGLFLPEWREVTRMTSNSELTLLELASIPMYKLLSKQELSGKKLRLVASGTWHCDENGSVTLPEIMSALAKLKDPVLGTLGAAWRYESSVQVLVTDLVGTKAARKASRESTGQIQDAKNSLAVLVGSGSASSGALVWVPYHSDVVSGPLHRLAKSSVIHYEKFESVSYQLTLEIPSRGVVRLPRGWRFREQDAVFGADYIQLYLAFRGRCNVTLLPGKHGGIGDVVLLMGAAIDGALDGLLHPKSTEARFVREIDCCAVIRPLTYELQQTGSYLREVDITDPLEDWVAFRERRLEAMVVGGVIAVSAGAYGAVLRGFRTAVPGTLEVGGLVSLTSPEATVMFRHAFPVLVKPIIEQVDKSKSAPVGWSARVIRVEDAYCMDDGGPSGDDFSDAV